MGVRFHAPTSNDFSAMNFTRATSLDKSKTDWFHEISNLFSITTDQVSGGHEITSEMHGSDSTVKYHTRMLQNRAKLNLVMSMVERYVRGTLSVENVSQNQKKTNITPWTMVSPDDVCPVDRHHGDKTSMGYKETFTVEEALDKLTRDDSSDATSSELCSTSSTDVDSEISCPSPTTNENHDEFIESKTDDGSQPPVTRELEATGQVCLPGDDVLAKACALLNRPDGGALESNLTGEASPNSRRRQHSSNGVIVQPISSTTLIRKSHLTQTLPKLSQRLPAKSVKVFSAKNLQSLVAAGGKVLFLTNGNASDNTKSFSTAQSSSSCEGEREQRDVIEIVPATLPDGRVIQLEVTRNPRAPFSHQQRMPKKNGPKHVILPRGVNEVTPQRTVGRIVRLNSDLINGSRVQNSTSTEAILKTTSQNIRRKEKRFGAAQRTVPMVCLKRPAVPIAAERHPLEQPTSETAFRNRICTSNSVDTLSRVRLDNFLEETALSPAENSRKRTHSGEMKVSKALAKEGVVDSSCAPASIADVSCQDSLGQSSTKRQCIDETNTEREDALNISLLNELMDKLPPGDDDEEIGSMAHGDILSDVIRGADESVPANATEIGTDENSNKNATWSGAPNGASIANVSGSVQSSTTVDPDCHRETVQRNQEKRPRSTSNEVKRRALSSIDTNANLGISSLIDNNLAKPKRKYTKRVDIQEGPDDKVTKILGPTAAAAAKNPYHKPPLSYNILIYLSFKNSGFRCLTVKQIYNFILKTFPYFTYAHQTWQNAIRHQLCCCKVYEKVPITEVEGGVEKTSGKSAWRVLNDACVKKLKEDAITTLAKAGTTEKLRISLSDNGLLHTLFGDLLEGIENREVEGVQKARGLIEAQNSLNVQSKDPGLNWDPHMVEKNCSSTSTSQEADCVESDLSLFEDFANQQNSLYFDISSKTLDISSIYSI